MCIRDRSGDGEGRRVLLGGPTRRVGSGGSAASVSTSGQRLSLINIWTPAASGLVEISVGAGLFKKKKHKDM